MFALRSRPRRLSAALAAVVALVAVAAGPVDGQEPTLPLPPLPASSEVSVLEGESVVAAYRDCDGTDIDAYTYGYVAFERTGDPGDELEVPISYSGSAAGDLLTAEETAFFFEDEDYTEIYFEIDSTEPAELTVTIDPPEPGAPYALGDPDSITLVVPGSEEDLLDCTAPLPIDESARRQTITVGEQPRSFGVLAGFFEFDGPVPDDVIDEISAFISTPTEGDLPPGLTYDDDRWSGAATTPGTYPFLVRLCFDSLFDDGVTVDDGAPDEMVDGRRLSRAIEDLPDVLCLGTAEVEVEVLPATTVAPPATPISGPARFTG